MQYDVAIIGGGVIGCAIARELSRFELEVVLLESQTEVGFGTSKTNSGIIHAGHHSKPDTLKGDLAVRGNERFDTLCHELNFSFRRIGELVVAQRPEEMEPLEKLKARGEQKGVPDLEMWDRARLQREEPNLSKSLVGALYAPSAGVINPYEFAFALIENATDNGVRLLIDSPVTAIDVTPDGLVVHTPKTRVAARFVLNCAGVFADRIAAMVGLHDFSIHPRKGEEYMLDKRLSGIVRRLVFPVPSAISKGILIIPTFDGTLMVGPTAHDTEDRHDLATTNHGAREVFETVGRICPAITARDTITAFAGLRAVSSTDDFIIGPTSVRGFLNVAGIQSPGLTAAPAIAEYVRDQLAAEGLVLRERQEFRAYVPGAPHFAAASSEERRRLIAEDPMFARVVCRCELVTEAEVHDAIDHGARTLDGIKFRSRAGMGRCQGGFCTSRCMEILAQRLGVRFDQVTKRGGGSFIVREMENGQHPRCSESEIEEAPKC